jgi:hypothetical protein
MSMTSGLRTCSIRFVGSQQDKTRGTGSTTAKSFVNQLKDRKNRADKREETHGPGHALRNSGLERNRPGESGGQVDGSAGCSCSLPEDAHALTILTWGTRQRVDGKPSAVGPRSRSTGGAAGQRVESRGRGGSRKLQILRIG